MNTNLETQYRLTSCEKPTVASKNIQAFEFCSCSRICFQNFNTGRFSPIKKCMGVVLKAKGALKTWFVDYAWPGMGLFGESYLLFSIGTLRPIWESLYPTCFSFEECSPGLLHSLTYSVVIGIIFGMLFVGYWADDIGRRKGSIITASLMMSGAIGLFLITFSESSNSVFGGMSGLLFIFGIGVGGEYPLSAASASEKATQRHLGTYEYSNTQNETASRRNKDNFFTTEVLESTSDDYSTPPLAMRGRQIQLVFSMQGLGIWFNSIVILILLFVTGEAKTNNYDRSRLLAIWRISNLIGAIILGLVLISRCLYLEESRVWEEDKMKREANEQSISESFEKSGKPNSSIITGRNFIEESFSHGQMPSDSTISSLSNPSVARNKFDEDVPCNSFACKDEDIGSPKTRLLKDYGSRLFGTSMSWFLWDIAFYGNKLFQSSFLLAMTGEETSLFQLSLAATINSTIALFGYFGAAVLIDTPGIGRLRLQIAGFLLTGLMFLLCGFLFDHLASKWIVLMYLSSSFFGQLGPNSTTFLIPAEIFPTEMRTFCHGISAAFGKLGALFAAILFNFIDEDLSLFLLCGYASVLAALVSVWAIPDTTGMNILELDCKWRMTLAGQKHLYYGSANHPKHWSMYEKWRQRRQLSFEEIDHAQLHDFA